MSTQPPTPTTQTPTTETRRTTTAATPDLGGRDRWRAEDEPEPEPASRCAQQQFDPFCGRRLPNRVAPDNQAMLRGRD